MYKLRGVWFGPPASAAHPQGKENHVKRLTLAIILTAAAAMAVSSVCGQSYPSTRPSRTGKPSSRPAEIEFMAQRLGLSDDQCSRLEKMEKDWRRGDIALWGKDVRLDGPLAFARRDKDEDKVAKLTEQKKSITRERRKLEGSFHADLSAILSQEQEEKYAAYRAYFPLLSWYFRVGISDAQQLTICSVFESNGKAYLDAKDNAAVELVDRKVVAQGLKEVLSNEQASRIAGALSGLRKADQSVFDDGAGPYQRQAARAARFGRTLVDEIDRQKDEKSGPTSRSGASTRTAR